MIDSGAWWGRTAVLCFILGWTFSPSYVASDGEEIDFPPLIDSDDIAYFFESGDIDGLHWALSNIFARSARNPNLSEVHRNPLPEQLVSRGGGSSYTTAYKLQHDIEQMEYLARNIEDKEKAVFFGDVVTPIYKKMLATVPPLEDLERTNGLYPFRQADYDLGMGTVYNKALHHTNFPEMKDSAGNAMPLLNAELNVDVIEDEMKSTGVVIVDDLLNPPALERIRQVMLESTVWYQTKMPKKFGGYLGAYIDDGLHDRILLQLAFELYHKFPRMMAGNFLKYLWAYKYDSDFTGINTHADEAAVNVNIWLTPDSANLDPSSGGLVVFTTKPPDDWDFKKFNTDTEMVHAQLLRPAGYANITVPHKQNRAVIFDSALFHHTDNFSFKKGYENRRINLTLLYGNMRKSTKRSNSGTEL